MLPVPQTTAPPHRMKTLLRTQARALLRQTQQAQALPPGWHRMLGNRSSSCLHSQHTTGLSARSLSIVC